MSLFFKVACLALLSTLALVGLGGFVHNSGSSLACPDWPLCYGQVFPKMEGGILIEHSHRLLAAFVGLVVIALVILSSRAEKARPGRCLRQMSWIALGLVIFQGVLGGTTVLMQISPLVSTAHLATSQIFLAVLIAIVFASRPRDILTGPAIAPATKKTQKHLAIATLLVFVQMLLGASIRHGGAGVACGLGQEAALACLDATTGEATFWPSVFMQKWHMLHRFMGVIAMAAVIWGTIPVLKWGRLNGFKGARVLSIFAHLLVTVQVGLGIAVLWTHIGPHATLAHLLTAMFLWTDLILLNLWIRKPAPEAIL